MKAALVLALTLPLAGCYDEQVSAREIERSMDLCSSRGGLAAISAVHLRSQETVYATCTDATYVEHTYR